MNSTYNEGDTLLRQMFSRNSRYTVGFELIINISFTVDFIVVAILLDDVSYAAVALAEVFWFIAYALNALISYGSVTVRARYLGENSSGASEKVFTASVILSIIGGAAIAAFALLFSDTAAALCGMNSRMIESGSLYITGSGIGIIPYVLSRMFSKNMIADGVPGLVIAASVVSGIANVFMDILVLKVLHMNAGAVGVTTSISYYILMIILCFHFRSGSNTLKMTKWKLALPACADIVKTGFPKALSQIGTMLCMILINNLVVRHLGLPGATALALKDSVNCILIAVIEGFTETFGMMASLMYGERSRVGLRKVTKDSLRGIFIIVVVLSAAMFAAAPSIASCFGITQPASVACSVSCLHCLAVSMPLLYLSYMILSYLSISGERVEASAFSSLIVFFAPAAAILALKFIFGIDQLWISYPLAAAAAPAIYVIWRLFGTDRAGDFIARMLALPEEEFSFDKHYSVSIANDLERVEETVLGIRDFCADNGIDKSRSNILQLSVEEMVRNIIIHGFRPDTNHVIDISVKVNGRNILLRIRDDGIPFNPLNYERDESDPASCIGIYMIKSCSLRVDYYYAAMMNNLVVEV